MVLGCLTLDFESAWLLSDVLPHMLRRDMRSEIADESFGTVIDKGTLDAILCGHDAFENAARLLLECSRCARKDPGLQYHCHQACLSVLLDPKPANSINTSTVCVQSLPLYCFPVLCTRQLLFIHA